MLSHHCTLMAVANHTILLVFNDVRFCGWGAWVAEAIILLMYLLLIMLCSLILVMNKLPIIRLLPYMESA